MREPLPSCLPCYAQGPEVPPLFSRRGITLARMRDAMARGRWNERVQVWTFDQLTSPNRRTQTIVHGVTSLGGRFVKLLALRGVLTSSTVRLGGFELAGLKLRMQLNGVEDLITGGAKANVLPGGFTNTSSFAMLFGTQDAAGQQSSDCPPYVFADPPQLRASDKLAITVTSVLNEGEGTPTLTCQVMATFIDADLYDTLYTEPVLEDGEWNPWAPGGQP